jgi:outer membrane beta-barrel protein
MNQKYFASLFILLSLMAPLKGHAQSTDEELNVIELELDKSAPKPAPQEQPRANQGNNYLQDNKEPNTMSDFSGLGKLAPFKDISVIQKRYLPKTNRFQLFGGLTTVTNDPFFATTGAVVKLGYFLTETWGLELNYFALTTSERQSTSELRSINGVTTQNLIYPKSYLGLDVMYVPIYGKISWFNEKIVPFDLYFSGGMGTTGTGNDQNAGTLHIATGQMFALSKAFAFRWDFSWNFYSAKGVDGSTSTFNNLFLTVGMSWFFPEATYR